MTKEEKIQQIIDQQFEVDKVKYPDSMAPKNLYEDIIKDFVELLESNGWKYNE